MAKLFVVFGVPAAGKTTLCRSVVAHARQCGQNVRHESAGEIKRLLLRLYNIRKHISDLNDVESILLNALYFDKIKLREEAGLDDDVLVDTHATYPNEQGCGYNRLLPDVRYPIDKLVLLQTNVPLLIQRREARGRAHDTVITGHCIREQEEEAEKVRGYATHYAIPLLDIGNNGTTDRELTATTQRIYEFLYD